MIHLITLAITMCISLYFIYTTISIEIKNWDKALVILKLLDGPAFGAWNQDLYIKSRNYQHLTPEQYVELYTKAFKTDKEFHTLPKNQRI